MSEVEEKPEKKDLHWAIGEATSEVIREQREEIIKRARKKLQEKFPQTPSEKQAD